MISHQHRCIFIHIPKCAGTSIEKALGHLDNHEGRWGQDHRTMTEIERSISKTGKPSLKDHLDKSLRMCGLKKKPKSNPNNRIFVTKGQYDEYFKFTIIRNPWARFNSLYQNIMRDELKRKRRSYPADLTLNGFLRHQAKNGLLRAQTHWLKSMDDSINFDFIGRFETLRQDFETACAMMGVRNIELPHVLKGTSTSHHAFYDEESVGIVADVCKEEIERLGYTFDGG